MTSAGVVTTLAGLAEFWENGIAVSGSVDGVGSAARFAFPRGVAVDGTGNVYVADTVNFTDGTGSNVRFGLTLMNLGPTGVAVDGAGNLYVADFANNLIRKGSPALPANPPAITKQPTNQTAALFGDATFRVSASGDAPLGYQWRFKDADLPRQTNAFLTVTNVQRSDAGAYQVVVTSPSGRVTSQLATLTITPFQSLYCFGFSWTDTQGILRDGSPDFANNNPDYWHNRTSNGPMWPEFLSSNLGLAYISANNYARGAARAGTEAVGDVLNQVLITPCNRARTLRSGLISKPSPPLRERIGGPNRWTHSRRPTSGSNGIDETA